MTRPNYNLLTLQTLAIYQMFTSLSYPITKLQSEPQNKIIGKETVNYITTLERKLLVDIKYKPDHLHKIKISIDEEGKILGYKYSDNHKKTVFENPQLPTPNKSFVSSTLFGSIKFIKSTLPNT